ncbi:ABC transporter ATP-binding protein [Photobacterium kishitanii]|uniref:ABC transporter ATP-binding protein n=1 Tax=Photobacterium kishitanii TaxID=318456 RepID=UPI000D1630A2|nr:ATP-binding cassette domain-containing protein [Photobacterium kishitanii]PSV23010.1 putative 2-aminoethylphosphonate ABC transporter ATP-binding protein [Photobacterium kishitanii]
MSFISIDHVIKDYEEYRALHGISLSIKRGEFICFLGPSGCGKTTLLNIIAGLHFPEQGKVMCLDEDITYLTPAKRKFGIVFQNYALFPNLTVSDNITYGLRGKEWNKAKRNERTDELLTLIGLPHITQRYPAELSGGQQQRVALARAIANSPRLLLLDEPLSALDAKVRVTLRNELKTLQRKLGITVIMVTHDQEEAMALADRIVVMNEGRIEQIGTPESLYLTPENRFVGEFIGSMNMLSIPQWAQGKTIGVRYEQVQVRPATEENLQRPYTLVVRVMCWHLMGAFYRLDLLMSDQNTQLYADVPYQYFQDNQLSEHTLVAITIPPESWCVLS